MLSKSKFWKSEFDNFSIRSEPYISTSLGLVLQMIKLRTREVKWVQ